MAGGDAGVSRICEMRIARRGTFRGLLWELQNGK